MHKPIPCYIQAAGLYSVLSSVCTVAACLTNPQTLALLDKILGSHLKKIYVLSDTWIWSAVSPGGEGGGVLELKLISKLSHAIMLMAIYFDRKSVK